MGCRAIYGSSYGAPGSRRPISRCGSGCPCTGDAFLFRFRRGGARSRGGMGIGWASGMGLMTWSEGIGPQAAQQKMEGQGLVWMSDVVGGMMVMVGDDIWGFRLNNGWRCGGGGG
ncbi:hypothetical protein Tsubulata_013960 [Turnera subulata]|uniref:Uncharacterized protein n=1 Tax=Turnera subulata TaxID=218843 RepID=A0A9Q0GJ03_9ROSI|nr:hypothetical protein Tsubulata_013960 [Turnera subulata]